MKRLELYGCKLDIYAIDHSIDMGQFLHHNWLPLLLLVILNLLPPSVFIFWLNRSFVERLQILTTTVRNADNGVIPLLEQVRGRDEIGMLMDTYNEMARRTNQLIETVYKSRLREQETDLARQQAELLALRSQINPHFLFNVLESIRMQSILKEEKKTAEMIGMLAYIERQYVDWGADVIPLSDELRCVEAYLRLQRYRLSGYSDFEYARRAIRYDCMDYLLKPVMTDQLTELLQKVQTSCRRSSERKKQEAVYTSAYLAQNLLALLQEQYDDKTVSFVESRLKLAGGIRYVSIARQMDRTAPVPAKQVKIRRQELAAICREYLNNCRIEQAAQLLITTSDKVYSIAQAVGYQDMDYFIERFITAKGCTPSNYRKTNT